MTYDTRCTFVCSSVASASRPRPPPRRRTSRRDALGVAEGLGGRARRLRPAATPRSRAPARLPRRGDQARRRPLQDGADRPVGRRPLDQPRVVRERPDARAAVVADARRRADRHRAHCSTSCTSWPGTRRSAPVQRLLRAVDDSLRADAEPRRRAAVPAAQRAGARHQPRRAAAAGARRPGAEGAARSPAARARLQPAQPELAHVGRQDEAGVDLPARRRLRRGPNRDAGAAPGQAHLRGHPADGGGAGARAGRAVRRRVRGARVRRQRDEVGDAGRPHRDGPVPGRIRRQGTGQAERRRHPDRARRAGHGRGAGGRPGASTSRSPSTTRSCSR